MARWERLAKSLSSAIGEDKIFALEHYLMQTFEEVDVDNVAKMLFYVVHGVTVVGVCAACAVAQVYPAAAAAEVALVACEHLEERMAAYNSLVHQTNYVTTAGAVGGSYAEPFMDFVDRMVGTLESSYGGQFERAVPRAMVQAVAAFAAAGSNPKSRSALASALVSGVNLLLADQTSTFNVLCVVRELLMGLEGLQFTAGEYNFDEISGALLRNYIPPGLPVWMGAVLSLSGKLLGLSVASSLSNRLVPATVLKFCREARITPGCLVQDVIDAVRDLLDRSRAAWAEGSFNPLFETIPKGEHLKNAMTYSKMASSDVPGSGSGYVLIDSRIKYAQEVIKQCRESWKSLSPGAEKAFALRVLTDAELKFASHKKQWWKPGGKPRPVNVGIVGTPGVGKTLVSNIVAETIMLSAGLTFDPSMIYAKSAGVQWWDGFDMALHQLVVVDELGALSKDMGGGDIFADLLGVMGEVPVALRCADVEQINEQFPMNLGTVLMSNMQDFGAGGVLTHPGAFMRRLDVRIDVVAADDYRIPGSTEIDSSLLAASNADTPLWNGTVAKSRTQGEHYGFVDIGTFHSQRELIAIIEPLIKHKLRKNEEYMAGVDSRSSVVRECMMGSLANEGGSPNDARMCASDVLEVMATAGEVRTGVRGAALDLARALAAWSGLDCLWTDRGWAATLRAAGVWLLVWCFFSFGVLAAVAAALLVKGVGQKWAAAVERVTEASVSVPWGLVQAATWFPAVVSGLGAAWFLPFAFRLSLVERAAPLVALLELARMNLAYRRLEAWKPIMAVAFAVACFSAGKWLLSQNKLEPEETRTREVRATAAKVPFADELIEKVRADPVGWLKGLRACPPVADDGSWRNKTSVGVAMGSLRPELLPRCMAGGEESLKAVVFANTYKARLTTSVDGEEVTLRGTVTCLGGCFYVTAHHLMRGAQGGYLTFEPRDYSEQGMVQKVFPMSVGVNWTRVGGMDMAVFNVATVPRQQVLRWCPAELLEGQPARGTRASVLRPEGSSFRWEDTVVAEAGGLRAIRCAGVTQIGHSMLLSCASEMEMSGAPVYVRAGNGVSLCGLVCGNLGGLSPQAAVQTASEAELRAAMVRVTPSPRGYVATGGLHIEPAASKGKIHSKSWANRSSGLGFGVVSAGGARVTMRTKWEQNPLSAAWPSVASWAKDRGSGEFAVPAFSAYYAPLADGTGKYVDPFGSKMDKMRGETMMLPELCRAAVASYCARLPTDMSDGYTEPLSVDEAIFGGPRCGRIDLSKSAGAMGGTKASHVDFANKCAGPKLAAAIEAIESQIREGCYVPSRVRVVMKNELRELSKAAGGARVIAPGDFALFVVQRRHLQPLGAAVFSAGYTKSGMAVGMNAANPREWGGLAEYLRGGSQDGKVLDGDLSAMDDNEQLDAAQCEAAVFGEVARRKGCSEEYCDFVEALAFLTFINRLDVDGVEIIRVQGRDTGEFMTDFRNCLQLYFKLFFAYHLAYLRSRKPGDPPFPPWFNEAVRLIILGDDHVLGVLEAVRAFFNAETIARELEQYGDVYTAADKSVVEGDGYKTLSNCTFLGRKFEQQGALWAAPLALNRCAKAYAFVVGSSTATKASVAESMVLNTLHELVMHGEDEYNKFVEALPGGPLQMKDGSTFAPRVPKYATLRDRWERGGLSTWEGGGQFSRLEEGMNASWDVDATSGVVLGEGGGMSEECVEGTLTTETEECVTVVMPSTMRPAPMVGSVDDWAARSVLLLSQTVTASSVNASGHLIAFNPLSLLMQNPTTLRKVANSKFLVNGRLNLSFSIASTKLHRGMYVIGVAPVSAFWAQAGTFTVQQVAQMGGVVSSFVGPHVREIEIPLITAAGYVNLEQSATATASVLDTAQVYFSLLAPLSHATLATPPAVVVQVRASFIGGRFFGPTDATAYTVTAGVVKGGSVAKEAAGGVFSRPAFIVSSALGQLAEIPMLAPFATPAAYLAGMAAGVAAYFGFGRPAEREAAKLMMVGPNLDLYRSVGLDPTPVADIDPAAASAPFPGAGGWPAEDQMSLAYLAQRPYMVVGSSNVAEWSTTASAGTVLFSLPVCPLSFDLGADGTGTTVLGPVSAIAGSCSLWRGDMVLKIVVGACMQDAGRLRFAWIPGTGTIGAIPLDFGQRYSLIVDVQDSTEAECVVRFQAGPGFLPLPQAFASVQTTAYSNTNYAGTYNNGVLKCFVETPLTSSLATTAIALKVFATWENLVVAKPSGRLWNTLVFTAGRVELVPPFSDGADGVYCVSSNIGHLRPLLERFTLVDTVVPVKANATDLAGSIAWMTPAYTWGTEGKQSNVANRWHAVHDLLVKCYSVFRGAAKHRYVKHSGGGASIRASYATQVGVCGYVPCTGGESNIITGGSATSTTTESVPWGPLATSFSTGSTPDHTGTVLGQSDDAGMLGMVVPWQSTIPWHQCISRAYSPGGLPLPGDATTCDPVAIFGCAYDGAPAVAATWCWSHFQAWGDDVIFHGFVCNPACAAQAWPI